MAKPFLRWAGSKRQLLKHLVEYWPGGDTRYIEPFAGSASLFFELEPRFAVLGDVNSSLIATYEVIRERPRDVHQSLTRWSKTRTEYYRIRDLSPSRLSNVEQAARFIYLNRLCFNGLYRTNKSGHFNVPYGGMKTGETPSIDVLTAASKLLSRSELVSGDFENTIDTARANDFVYLDPPFAMTHRRVFTEYAPKPFGTGDLIRLRQMIANLDARGATFLLSYADCDEGRQLSDGFRTTLVATRRSISGFIDSRRSTNELIVTNSTIKMQGVLDG